MLPPRVAAEVADRFDLDRLPACPMCLFDLAWAIHSGKPRTTIAGALTRTTSWVWDDIEDGLRLLLALEERRGTAHAADALAVLDERHWRSPLVRIVVERLARRLVEEIREKDAARHAEGNGHVVTRPPLG